MLCMLYVRIISELVNIFSCLLDKFMKIFCMYETCNSNCSLILQYLLYHQFDFSKVKRFYLMINSIYGVHDEAKDKAFELEMSWVCDESNRQHQKVIYNLKWLVCFKLVVLLFLCCYHPRSLDLRRAIFWVAVCCWYLILPA